jgi:hypothetical protein
MRPAEDQRAGDDRQHRRTHDANDAAWMTRGRAAEAQPREHDQRCAGEEHREADD